MIRYDLVCDCGNRFEGWFADSAAFDAQQQRGLLECPLCGSRQVRKAPMAPAVLRARDRDGKAAANGETAVMPAEAERFAALLRTLRAIQKHVEEHFENVGERFPEEARRIHYGETEPRDIWGQASREEARELLEEGIMVMPLPRLPDHDA
jgi:hypothetical protein